MPKKSPSSVVESQEKAKPRKTAKQQKPVAVAKPKAKVVAKPKAKVVAKPKAKVAAKPKAKVAAKPKAKTVATVATKPKAQKAAAKPKPQARKQRAEKPVRMVERTEVLEGSGAPSLGSLVSVGGAASDRDLTGRPYVLYFYPKDETPGCTKEACAFRDMLPRFAEQGVRVLGVSPDSVASHERFRQKHGLGFTLLSDDKHELAQAYGVWVKKQNYGREYMGVERSTFLIDGNGVVRRVWRGVRVDGHVQEVLEALAGLG
jgi:peroxiredoxin Q/BCP